METADTTAAAAAALTVGPSDEDLIAAIEDFFAEPSVTGAVRLQGGCYFHVRTRAELTNRTLLSLRN